MRIEAFEFELKDGRRAFVRSPEESDIPGTLEYLRVTAGDTEFLLRYPEECSRYTYESEKAFFERTNTSANEAMLLCEVDGRVAATAQVMWNTGIKTRHRATVAIAVIKDLWGMGIGARLMEKLIAIARSNPDIIQVELEFIEGNSRARALYERLGFRITGLKPNAIRLKDGTLLNEYSMVKTLERG